MLLYSAAQDISRTPGEPNMPKPRAASLETATARLRLTPRKKPYCVKLAIGIALGYRRNAGAGTWSVRVADGAGGEWLKRIALADDLEPAAPPQVLTYWQAMEVARKLARRQAGAEDESRPVTVAEALDRYETDLNLRGGDPQNARRGRAHLSPAIASKPVSLVGANDLKRFRDAIAASDLTAATVNRVCAGLRAALTLAAEHDTRIGNQRAWKVGLRRLPNAHRARNVILDDAAVRLIVEKAHAHDPALGLLTETLASTGARLSQAARLECGDLQADRARLMLPCSGKGRVVTKRHERRAVPISYGLTEK